MIVRRLLAMMCATILAVEAKYHYIQKRHTVASSLCVTSYNNTNKVQCYCMRDAKEQQQIKSADCYLTNADIQLTSQDWDAFEILSNSTKLTLTNNRGVQFHFIPTNAIKFLKNILKLDIKYGNIDKIHTNALAESSTLQELSLRENQIRVLETKAIADHPSLTTINLDQNNIEEINRNVFVNLPSLEKLFLTSNKITTLHDRAFVHLSNLKELEINMNSVFSLNNETFSGLKKLEKLDLSDNNIEVIGDNTFLPLENVLFLSLGSNKIQMLDEKAFNGLTKLQSLYLARNKLSQIDNLNVFKNLVGLTSLSLRLNGMKQLKEEVLSPILRNFYTVSSSFDIEDNNFTCACQLDWFMHLMKNTENKNLKITLENLKCIPSTKLRESWAAMKESEKNNPTVEEDAPQGGDYEYYDDTQLDGMLFYIDVRDLLSCPGLTSQFQPSTVKPATPRDVTTPKASTVKLPTTKSVNTDTVYGKSTLKMPEHRNDVTTEKKPAFTTSRLATVSAKPVEDEGNKLYDNMASDEAKPDKLKAHRNFEPISDDPPEQKVNSSHKNVGCVFLMLMLCMVIFMH